MARKREITKQSVSLLMPQRFPNNPDLTAGPRSLTVLLRREDWEILYWREKIIEEETTGSGRFCPRNKLKARKKNG